MNIFDLKEFLNENKYPEYVIVTNNHGCDIDGLEILKGFYYKIFTPDLSIDRVIYSEYKFTEEQLNEIKSKYNNAAIMENEIK